MTDRFSDEHALSIFVNGRQYPMWSQFVHRKGEWIGGILEDSGDAFDRHVFGGKIYSTEITDIKLEPNGKDHAWFEVSGKEFNCGFCTTVGGLVAGEEGWVTFSGYQGHTWRIKRPDKSAPKPEPVPELPLT